MQTIINDVKMFLDNTNEIVIFDVQEFSSNFNGNLTIHEEFIEFLKTEFNDYALPYAGWNVPLNKIWSQQKKKNLIIAYDDHRFFNHFFLWPSVTQQWGNVQSRNDLFLYLRKVEDEALSSRKICRFHRILRNS
ncbi:PI-PLC X domain-containing protein 1-like [Leptopilina heterotoma]|uniref:PI-PLC X domain-containing protein 1-like n=1 Tax=Leptopilina heterotoma TaxID=63436 RepID=UPI001CA8C264|nr:PI-PLC X domain-containing protein 1-like [Leptopilina heterotoma]XP_043466502.1 PI-PLC X domain-containing protein 1-like [Leptopilina heterotoma]